MSTLDVRILATGRYLPSRRVLAAEIDGRLGLEPGTCARMSGVEERYYVADGETASDMGAAAARDALANSGLQLTDIDLLLCGSGTSEQPIPSNSALIQKKLGAAGLASFDVGATCMGFVVGLEVAASLIVSGVFRRVLLVCADVASCGLNEKELEAYCLFGDGAAAAVVARSDANAGGAARRPSRILGARFATYAEGAGFTEIRGGGSALPAHRYAPERRDEFLFHMEGPKVFRLSLQVMPPLLDALLAETGVTLDEVDLVVPHQASHSALELMRRRLGVEPRRWVSTMHKHGNTISASLPLALDESLREGRVSRGDRLLLFGAAAGFSTGQILLDY